MVKRIWVLNFGWWIAAGRSELWILDFEFWMHSKISIAHSKFSLGVRDFLMSF
jgi:hypothetical protein